MPEIALNPPPFNPVWEKGAGGMRGKRRGMQHTAHCSQERSLERGILLTIRAHPS